MVALRIFSLLLPGPAIADGFGDRRGGGASRKPGDSVSDAWRGIPGEGGRSFRVLIYGDGGPSECREGDLRGGAIIPSGELRLGRMRGRRSRGRASTRALKREPRVWGLCIWGGAGAFVAPARPMKKIDI